METGLIENIIQSPRILLQRISPTRSSPTRLSSPEMKCSICLDHDIEDDSLCSTDCSHQFCKKCLDEWFDQNKTTCPMCRTDIKYFNYQGRDNRIIKLTSNGNNQRDLRLIDILQVRLKTHRMFSYFLILFNVYTTYTLSYYENERDLYKNDYEKCNYNLTHTLEENIDLSNYIETLSGINDELINQDPESMVPYSLVNIIQNNQVISCLFPEYYVDKCIGG